MRSGGIFILFTLLVPVFAQPAFASHPFERQRHEIRTLEIAVSSYHHDHGIYPVTDKQSTWYEMLVAAGSSSDSDFHKVASDGRFPLDFYGYPLIFEPPSAANGNQIVIRTVGKNGIDDHGALDDWDSRYGPNLGYWYKTRWPDAYRRAWICGVLGVVGLLFIAIKIKQIKAKFVVASLWLSLLAGVVLPIGFDSGWSRSSASIDPEWITPISGIGVLLFEVIALFLIIQTIRTALRRRSLRLTGTIPCKKCNYDLRGTIAANINRCPECGEPVSDDSTVQVDLTPPPSP